MGANILEQMPDYLKGREEIYRNLHGKGWRFAIVTDETVAGLYGEDLVERFRASGLNIAVLPPIKEGEGSKSIQSYEEVASQLEEGEYTRHTVVVALGGGVIGDLAGFVAATYLRGVPLVQIPTTLLAQVDSSIGGKVAVNHGRLKNKIGAFYHPALVIADINVLKTLSAGDISDGLAETIKYGVIRDAELFAYLERNVERVKSFDLRALESIVFRSAKIKADVVSKDELDSGLRNILNYGHTVGHALESVSDFGISHGQAVAIGMVVAARISSRMGTLPEGEAARIKELITRAGLPVELPILEVTRLIHAMKHDKKVLQGRIRFVLPRRIGEVIISGEVTISLVEQVLLEG